MNQKERLTYLVKYLLKEKNLGISIPQNHDELFQLYRSLVNIREANSISQEFLNVQDEMLQEENHKKGIVTFENTKEKMIVWKGDITRLKVDAIVNAANQQMEGCFVPGHYCIDNAIHTYAGVQLVGPTIKGHVTKKERLLLASCYESCLRLAEQYHFKTIAFCCISTGVFHFPQDEAAKIAVKTVTNFLQTNTSIEKVVFNVFKQEDYDIYKKYLYNFMI